MNISVIIPTLNEEDNIADAINSASEGVEVIVVDGGSTDATRDIARNLGADVRLSERGRGIQLETGALSASGDVLLFLHADTRLPRGWLNMVEKSLRDKRVVGGAFKLRIGSKRKIFRLIEGVANIRSRYLGLIYGDQAIFARKEGFFEIGSLRTLPLMEDVECIKRLRKIGDIVIIDAFVVTSERRWADAPVLLVTLRNWGILLRYLFGMKTERLYSKYYKTNNREGGRNDV